MFGPSKTRTPFKKGSDSSNRKTSSFTETNLNQNTLILESPNAEEIRKINEGNQVKNNTTAPKNRAITSIPFTRTQSNSGSETDESTKNMPKLKRSRSYNDIKFEPIATETRKSITLIGPGQITATLVAKLSLHNRLLKSQGKDDKIIDIYVLGREGSQNLKAFEEDGIHIHMRDSAGSAYRKHHITQEEFQTFDKAQDVPPSNHIFILTKAFSHDKTLQNSLKILQEKAHSADINDFTVIYGQNGIPAWFLKKKGASHLLDEDELNLLNSIDETKLVGSIINIAAQSLLDNNSNVIPGCFEVTTPLNEMRVALARITTSPQDEIVGDIEGLLEIFSSAAIDVSTQEDRLIKELFFKLQLNVVLNGPCTLSGKNVAAVKADPFYHNLAMKMLKEINTISQVLGLGDLRDRQEMEKRMEKSANRITSMGMDFLSFNPLETEAIYGKLAKLSIHLDEPIEIIPRVYKALKNLENYRDNNLVKENKLGGSLLRYQTIHDNPAIKKTATYLADCSYISSLIGNENSTHQKLTLLRENISADGLKWIMNHVEKKLPENLPNKMEVIADAVKKVTPEVEAISKMASILLPSLNSKRSATDLEDPSLTSSETALSGKSSSLPSNLALGSNTENESSTEEEVPNNSTSQAQGSPVIKKFKTK